METTTREAPAHARCPRCGCAQPMPPNGRCRACGASAEPSRRTWKTAMHSVQPEERNGRGCLECGDEVFVSLPPFGPSSSPFASWVVIGIVAGPLLASLGGRWEVALYALAPAAALLPLHLVYRRNGGPAAMRRIVVACTSCGSVRFSGLRESPPKWAWHRGQSFFRGLHRAILPVTAFFFALLIRAWATDAPTGWTAPAIFGIAAFFLVSVRWYRGVFGLRGWW